MKKKVCIFGAGNVGASLAQLTVFHSICDTVLFDIAEGLAEGKALDLAEACPLYGSSARITGTSDFHDTEESDIIVITAGFARKPGMSRDDLLSANAEVVQAISEKASRYSPEAIIIVVTNPMDVMAQLSWKTSGFPHQRVMGMGGILDSARFRTFVAWEIGVSPAVVEALVLGGHGDQMVPMPRFTTVRGIPITELITEERIHALIDRTRKGGAEIVSFLKTASAYYAPAASAYQMIKAVLFDERCLLPAACYLDGEYGQRGIYVGVPIILGSKGVERIIELPLNDQEKRDLEHSVQSVRALLAKLKM